MSNFSQVLLLGIPFDNLTLNSAIKKIIGMANNVKKMGNAKLVTTVNVDFLTNALGWSWNKPSRHPELLDILRRSDLVTADGMPIVWLSKIINYPLGARVAGSDLVPAIAKEAAKSGNSIFLLGGQGYVAHKAAEKLQQQHPTLKIAGVYAPFVYSEGEKMLQSEDYDEQIIDHINQCEPDILLIGFGNPKQELFFQRNQQRLKVGVAIGVGGTFEFVTGRVARAPKWMQEWGMEWLFRISQDPRRLWKRYAIGMFKLVSLALPLIIHDSIKKLFRNGPDETLKHNAIDIEKNNIRFPKKIINGICNDLLNSQIINDMAIEYEVVNLHFEHVNEIDVGALAGLVRLINLFQNQNSKVHINGIVNKDVIRFFKVNRVWDIFSKPEIIPTSYADAKAIIMKNNDNHLTIEKTVGNITVISLKGRLDAGWIHNMDNTDWLVNLTDTHCIMDLSQLQFIDSTGLRLFFKIKQEFKCGDMQIVFAGANKTIMQLFMVTKVDQLFHFCSDIEGAKEYIVNSTS